jgi:VCBS repeat-containing protein
MNFQLEHEALSLAASGLLSCKKPGRSDGRQVTRAMVWTGSEEGISDDMMIGDGQNPIPDESKIAGRFGTLMVSADGSYAYRLDQGNFAVAALSFGDSLEETFHFSNINRQGGKAAAILTITIERGLGQGIRLSEFIYSIPGNTEKPAAENPEDRAAERDIKTPLISGDLAKAHPGFSVPSPVDPRHFPKSNELPQDTIETGDLAGLHVTGVKTWIPCKDASGPSDGKTTGDGENPIKDRSQVTGKYGLLTVDANGSYTYQVDDNNREVIQMEAGETIEEVFYYTIADSRGKTGAASLTLTIVGNERIVVEEIVPIVMHLENPILHFSSISNQSETDRSELFPP